MFNRLMKQRLKMSKDFICCFLNKVDKKLGLSAAGSGVPLEWKAASEFGVGHATATHDATSGQSGRIR